MIHDPIIEEVRRWREELLARYGGDMHALAEAARRDTELMRQAGHPMLPPAPRPPRPPVVPPQEKKVG